MDTNYPPLPPLFVSFFLFGSPSTLCKRADRLRIGSSTSTNPSLLIRTVSYNLLLLRSFCTADPLQLASSRW
ncbi:hypothetical protein BDN71DRAFT_1453883 [Pleurotus eryngii]|uniref:Uncharacterized protein n=1 Tax=Pleurotus eryngii TaxID=5323 RepID=A0A9P5ZNU6_PLEER|nr:hypothetical protein BDN71DRAFT_1453883 [Pleurotus eryngii]